jgi:hypothetical protein
MLALLRIAMFLNTIVIIGLHFAVKRILADLKKLKELKECNIHILDEMVLDLKELSNSYYTQNKKIIKLQEQIDELYELQLPADLPVLKRS